MLELIPMPQKVELSGQTLSLAELETLVLPMPCSNTVLAAAVTLADELEAVTGKRIRFSYSLPSAKMAIRLGTLEAKSPKESYTLKIDNSGITLSGAGEAGLFYAMQTLRQLIRAEGALLPQLAIEDTPDFAHRGYYYDCTRGKVPTLATLFQLADRLAYYKLNQLQLYIEHTFAFARHSDIWSGSDPLTAEEIVRLDQYCAERHIELVPSLSTFGHLYMALRSKRNEHLNELDIKASEVPWSFHDRMCHYTLNASDPGSPELIDDMLAEFLPLFRSRYFNICCDETFDLGTGKNQQLAEELGSKTKLYVQFLKKLIALVKAHGKSVMFWGDIIASEPELIKELPADTVPLEWCYAPQIERDTAKMSQAGLEFYVCPGVNGWNHFLNGIGYASQNIVNYANRGIKYGASGLLNTDWGDYGHVNPLAGSYHGLALGAACGWNVKGANDLAAFDQAFSVLEFGDRSGKIVQAWRSGNDWEKLNWTQLERLFDPHFAGEFDAILAAAQADNPPEELLKAIAATEAAEAEMLTAFGFAHPLDALAKDEIICGLRGVRMVHKVMAALFGYPGFAPRTVADELRAFETRFAGLWHKRNKPSEYYRLREKFIQIAEYLDSL